MLTQMLQELRLNYVDEVQKPPPASAQEPPPAPAQDGGAPV
jgi:hypothetical protein